MEFFEFLFVTLENFDTRSEFFSELIIIARKSNQKEKKIRILSFRFNERFTTNIRVQLSVWNTRPR